MKTFEEWWKEYLPDHLVCMNYKKDFERCWEARKIVDAESKPGYKECNKCPEGWVNPDCEQHRRSANKELKQSEHELDEDFNED